MAERPWPSCDICRTAVTTQDGALGVTLREWEQSEADRLRTEGESPPAASGAAGSPEGIEPPSHIQWLWGHKSCLPDSVSYTIEAARLDDIGKVLDLTFDLLDKDWFLETNWRMTMGRLYRIPNA